MSGRGAGPGDGWLDFAGELMRLARVQEPSNA